MGMIATVGQQDNVSCGFYAGYAVSLVNQLHRFSPGLSMTEAEVEAARSRFYGGRKSTLSHLDAARYLNEELGVVTPYKMDMTVLLSGVRAKVQKSLSEGYGMMWGSVTHWYALLAIDGAGTMVVYDPAGQRGSILTTAGIQFLTSATYLVHPVW